jgi:hypothetical protein
MTDACLGGVFMCPPSDKRGTDAPLANQSQRAEARSHDLDSLSLSRRGHSLVGAASASRPPAARSGRSDHGMHTIDTARRGAPTDNKRAHSSTLPAGVVPPSPESAEAGMQAGTTETTGRKPVHLSEFHPSTLFGGVSGGGRFFIKNPPTPATPSHARGIREWRPGA